jgi:cellobiose epimerase
LKRISKDSKLIILIVIFLSGYDPLFAGELNRDGIKEKTIERTGIAGEMKKVLTDELDHWYPLCIDTIYGGFFSDIDYKWELNGLQNKMIVTQARHIWSASNAVSFYPEKKLLLDAACHGVKFLTEKMWDSDRGGFFEYTGREGRPLNFNGTVTKTAYGNAFAIYCLARYARASNDIISLKLAVDAFRWLEKHSYDSRNGGYFQYMDVNGNPFKEGFGKIPPKDQNSTIHLLESFTELYRVWPDPLLKERLRSLLVLVRDRIVTKKGYMNLYFKPDWTPVTFRDFPPDSIDLINEFDHVSFGHDVETAYLMLEASEVLGIKNDSLTLAAGKKMVDHALNYGWDEAAGGIHDRGSYHLNNARPVVIRKTKEWWAQAEALNSFLIMSDRFPEDSIRYYDKFLRQWEYCKRYLIDSLHGGWYWSGIDEDTLFRDYPKGTVWKADYHTSRALINCILRLEENINNDRRKQK